MSDLQSWTVLIQVCNSVLVILKESASLTMQFKRQPKWESFFFYLEKERDPIVKILVELKESLSKWIMTVSV